MNKGLLAVLFVPLFFIGWWYNTPTHIPCVPWEAVDYRGDNYWYNESGDRIMFSPEEDTYERCKDK